MPEHPDVRDLLSGSDYGINYFHCLEIVEILKETEASTKNFFGGYSSQRMSDWKGVVASYQRDQVSVFCMLFRLFFLAKFQFPPFP